MSIRRFISRSRALGSAMVAALFIVGCSDSLTVDAPQATQAGDAAYSKLQHAHLLAGSGKVLERYQELAVSTEFVIGISDLALDMNRVLERYEEMEGVHVKKHFRKVFRGFAISADQSAVAGLLFAIEADNDIDWIEPDARIQIGGSNIKQEMDDRQKTPWGVKHIGALQNVTAKKGLHDDAVEVYLLDSGVTSSDINLVEAVSFVGGNMAVDTEPDVVGHGTHVASTIACVDDRDGLLGVAQGVKLHSFRVLDAAGQTDLSTAIAAIDVITERRQSEPSTPIVVNISFGADVGTTEMNALDRAITESVASGVVFVIAAGNESIDAATVTPAHAVGAITVGASNRKDFLADFSNYGPVVDLFAPGEKVEGLLPGSLQYATMSGTSMAAPHVTGAVAVALATNPSASPEEVLQTLLDHAESNGLRGKVPSGTTSHMVDVAGI